MGRMTCHCFQWPIRRDLRISCYTTEKKNRENYTQKSLAEFNPWFWKPWYNKIIRISILHLNLSLKEGMEVGHYILRTKKYTKSLQYYLMSLEMYGWSRLISVNLTFLRLLMNIIFILKLRKNCENSVGPFSFDIICSLTSFLEKAQNCTDVIRQESRHWREVFTCFSGTRWTVSRNLAWWKKSYPLFKTSHEMIKYYMYVHPNIKSKLG